jgi:hypothetical protein
MSKNPQVKRLVVAPVFSICIPQYNRTSFVIEACRSIAAQTFRRFEICISDDCSTDGRSEDLLAELNRLDVSYVYERRPANVRYDGNLRAAIALATGRLCFLLGNDDALASTTVLEDLNNRLAAVPVPGVVITNYADHSSGQVTRRVNGNRLLGTGPSAAVKNFRNVSFVSGVLFERLAAQRAATARWDGSEFYQMFVMSRITALGGRLVAIDLVSVRKDIHIPGEIVDSYRSKPVAHRDRIVERPINVVTIGALVIDAIRPAVTRPELQRVAVDVVLQLLIFTYPFWIFEFRRVQSWKYAAGVCLTMRPKRMLKDQELSQWRRWLLTGVYGIVTAIGLCAPIGWFQRCSPWLHRFAKSFGQNQRRKLDQLPS